MERILSAAQPVVLLRGPAACGKTTAALALHRHLTAAGQGCLWLAPNAPAAVAARSALLEAAPTGVLVRPMVMTFAGLVGRILSDGQSPGALLSPFRRHLLLRSIVDELSGSGELAALSAVADTPGLVVSLDRAIAELKRAAVEPQALARAVGRRRGTRAELVAIYRRYQQHLHASKTYDLEGLTWLARDRLAAWPGPELPAGLGGVQAAIADGFTDFTPTQMDLLAHLSRLLPRVVITLPLDEDSRQRLWHWTGRTAENIRRTFAGRLTEIALSREAPVPPQAALWDRVFEYDFDAPRCDLPPGLSVIAAAGIEAEVAAVGRRVKRLLLDGAPAGSIAVLARSMDAYRPTIERVFADYRIPIRPAGRPLTAEPIVRFVLAAARLAPQFAYRDVLRAVRSSYFRPQALGEFDGATVAAAEAIVRNGNVVAGQNAYAHAARRLAARLHRAGEDLEEEGDRLPRVTPQQVLRAAEMLEALFALAGQARGAPGGGLAMLVDRLQLTAAACDHGDAELVARDLRALAAMEAALAELPRPAPTLAAVEQALRGVVCPPAAGESAVDVLSVLDARALRYRHVFCLGMTEGQFPRRFTEGALISERDRRDWAARGVVLDLRDDLVAREMLLLYLAVSRADSELTVSFLDADAAGRAAAPSSFLNRLLAPVGGLEAAQAGGIVERIGPGQFLPRCERLASDREAVTAAVAGLFDHDPDPRGAALAWAAACAPQRLAAAAAGLLARHRRWRRGPCDAYDGRISDGDLLGHLAERFGERAVFSASQLNTYGTCPWAFFASYVLDLQPTAIPADRLTPLDRGLFCHRVLFTVFSHLRDELGESFPLASADRGRVLGLLDEAIAEESARLEARGVAYPTLLRVQQQQMRDDLAEYLADQLDRAAQLEAQCLHFELGFGLAQRPAGAADPASVPHPVEIQTPAGPILLRGKIDRIDRVRYEDLAGPLVIDYKTGRLPSTSDIDAGRGLQLPLYAAACEKLLGQGCLGGAFHQIGGDGRQSALAAFKKHGSGFRAEGDFQQRRDAVMQRVGQFVQAIRAGRFDVLPSDDCPS
ncbi:MAG: PD-(D/E)XK nuclease family protein [Phycisphaerae bacterium]|nr:PD-(D/E)XK nuclease family protein [Phycisphaerae bacterium]